MNPDLRLAPQPDHPGPGATDGTGSNIGLIYTDSGNGARFAELHRNRFRHVIDDGHWRAWDGKRWTTASMAELLRAAKAVVDAMLAEAVLMADIDLRARAVGWALKSANAGRLEAMIKLAASEESIEIRSDQLDRDPFLLTVENGTIDLRDGTLHPHRQENYCTKLVPIAYSPTARAPRWIQFLREVFAGDEELIGLVQRAAGYSLTADTREEVFFLLHGKGCNGKSKLVARLMSILGDAALSTPVTTLVERDGKAPTNDLARLRGARFVAAQENESGVRLSESLIKQLTGNDVISARFLHHEFFDFRPTFKLWLSTNHKPRIRGGDDGIWRRIRLIPFSISFQGREDRELETKLIAELPGILVWAVAGCLRWQREGLGSARAVAAATSEYRAEEDLLANFVDDMLVAGGSITAARALELYKLWAKRESVDPVKDVTFAKLIAERPGVTRYRTKSERGYEGISEKVPS